MIRKEEETKQAELVAKASEFKEMQAQAETVSGHLLHLHISTACLFIDNSVCHGWGVKYI